MRKLIAISTIFLTQYTEAFAPIKPRDFSRTSLLLRSESEQNGITVMSLQGFENHEEDGERLAISIQNWLDMEWVPQEIHVQIGLSAKRSYIQCRDKGNHDIMDIMVQISDDLVANWSKYDKDAFINAWDVGNYASDFLHKMVGADSCSCSIVVDDTNL